MAKNWGKYQLASTIMLHLHSINFNLVRCPKQKPQNWLTDPSLGIMHRFQKDFASHKTTMRKKPLMEQDFFMFGLHSRTKSEKSVFASKVKQPFVKKKNI